MHTQASVKGCSLIIIAVHFKYGHLIGNVIGLHCEAAIDRLP